MFVGQRRQFLSCVPQPISAVVVPSSRKPSTLQVLTNSFDFLRLIGDLRVALAAVNHLDAELVRQMVELEGLRVVRDPSPPARPRTSVSASARSAMSSKPCLVKWLIRPGVGAVLDAPPSDPAPSTSAIIRRMFMCRQ